MKPRTRRFAWIAAGLAALGVAAALVLSAFQSNLVFFFSPSQVAAREAPQGRAFRIGGMVESGSLAREPNSLTVRFLVTDTAKTIPVTYTGLLPDLFKEGKGVVAQGQVGEHLALPRQHQREAGLDVGLLEDLDLLLERQVGRVAGGVGEGSRLADGSDEGRNPLVRAAQLQDLLDDGPVLDLELAGLRRRRGLVGPLLHLDAQPALCVGDGGTDDPAMQADDGHRLRPAWQAYALGDFGDRADLRVRALVLGHEQHALLVTDVGGEGDVHVGEDDGVFQLYEQQGAQEGSRSPVAF